MIKLHITIIMLALAAALTHAPVPPGVSQHIDDLATPAEEILHRFPHVVKIETVPVRATLPQGRLVHIHGLEPDMLRVLVQMHGLRQLFVDELPTAIADDLKKAGLEEILPVGQLDLSSRFALVVTGDARPLAHPLGWERVRVTTRAAFARDFPPPRSTRVAGP
jgi:hypothetical protein